MKQSEPSELNSGIIMMMNSIPSHNSMKYLIRNVKSLKHTNSNHTKLNQIAEANPICLKFFQQYLGANL